MAGSTRLGAMRWRGVLAGIVRAGGDRLAALLAEFTETGAPDTRRLILWAPVALGAGSAAYFALSFEPPSKMPLVCAAGAGLLLLAALVARSRARLFYSLVLAAVLAGGFALAQVRTQSLAPPPMEESERARQLEGWIEKVERSGTRERLLIRVISLEGADSPPRRVRVRADLGAFGPGDLVTLRAVLARPSGPAAPGGYDPARAAWYDGLAFTGFAIARPERLSIEDPPDAFARAFVAWRWRLAERVREKAGPRTGGIAAALLTGDRSGVSAEDSEALRLSGLGHILAISGLHMALLAGAIYFTARYVFAAIEPYARAHDPRKPAALIALMAGLAYLVVSGAAVSTQRAFVMAAVVLIGVMIDRRGFSFRSLALAALIVLLIAPESVIEVGFQMSFAAVAALIAAFDIWQRVRGPQIRVRSWFSGLRDSFTGLAATSLIAGGATGAFAAFHFQRLAAYGFFANLLAMPVFTFLVMPAGVAALVAMPFGLEGPLLKVMSAGLVIVLEIAHRTAETDGAAVAVSAAPGLVVALFGLGFALLTMGRGAARSAGLGLCALAFGAWGLSSAPSMMITDSGTAIARFEASASNRTAPEDDAGAGADDTGWAVSNRRRGRFDTRVFLQRIGQGDGPALRAPLTCDPLGCTGTTVDGLRLAFTASGEALAEDCQRVDIVVFDGAASPFQKRRCAALLLDEAERNRLGSTEVWIRDGQVLRLRGANSARGNRPWTVPPG